MQGQWSAAGVVDKVLGHTARSDLTERPHERQKDRQGQQRRRATGQASVPNSERRPPAEAPPGRPGTAPSLQVVPLKEAPACRTTTHMRVRDRIGAPACRTNTRICAAPPHALRAAPPQHHLRATPLGAPPQQHRLSTPPPLKHRLHALSGCPTTTASPQCSI